MTNPENSPPIDAQRRRVVLVAPCFPDAEAAMSITIALARQTGAEMHGVLVHDTVSRFAAGGTVSTVVSYSGGRATGVTLAQMQAAVRADARRFREKLQFLAQEAAVPSVFQEADAELTKALQATARSGDVIVVGFKPIVKRGDDIVVVLDPESAPPEFAVSLARQLNKRLVSVTLGANKDVLLAELDRMTPAAVILGQTQADLPSLGRIVDAARCPVIVPH